MRDMPFRYSLDYYDWAAGVVGDFENWLDWELRHGGTSDASVDYKIVELVTRYVPSSPRQLLELGMQCEALLDVGIEDEIFDYRAEDAYEALRIAVTRFIAQELEARWKDRMEQAGGAVADLRPRSDGNGSRLPEDDLADAA